MGYRIAVLQDRERFEAPADVIVTADRYPGWGATVNRLFREVVTEACPVIVSGGDDMLPDPDHSAGELAEQFIERFAGTFGVMQPTGDEFEQTGTICGSPWLGRAWMERMYRGHGGMPECYVHNWADEELYWVAKCSGRLWQRPDLTQRHEHFRRRGESAPDYWIDSAARHDERDCLTFIARRAAGFPGAEPVDEPALLDLGVLARAYAGKAEEAYKAHHGEHGSEASDRLGAALDALHADGCERVAIFGAGQHTRRCGDTLCRPPVSILAIIDESPERIGTRLWNYPVVSPAQALTLGLDAVVLSSDAMEDRLRGAAQPLANAGVRVVGLYESVKLALKGRKSA